ncbi:hypothetical protein CGJ30_17765 [Vibrio parahaemolyticus]|nr:hypothetical protein CGJ30_17765 [Vibrio parahaemolyticus]
MADSISNSEAATVRNFINVLFKVSEKPKISQGSPLLDKLIGNQQLSFRQFCLFLKLNGNNLPYADYLSLWVFLSQIQKSRP